MKIKIDEGLPFIAVNLIHRNKTITLKQILVDTGSAGTIFDIDELAKIDLLPEPEDEIHTISGVGGSEFVVEKMIDQIALGTMRVENFPIEIGAVDYGLGIQGILGFDFLLKTQSIIDLSRLAIRPSSDQKPAQ
ncbi:retropepsin-like aspartic protease [Deltaproteobacteria bacterium TL4]